MDSLRAFQAFTKASSEGAARNAVFAETTNSTFAITPSVFSESEFAPDGQLKIVGIVTHANQVVA